MLDRTMNETLAEFNLDRGSGGCWAPCAAPDRPIAALRETGRGDGPSSGAMTNRLDRLETAGLIRRLPDPDDRRAWKVEPTDAGWQAWQDSTGAQAQKEGLGLFEPQEKDVLNGLLRRLMLEFERLGAKVLTAR